jgi:hypothetical protein
VEEIKKRKRERERERERGEYEITPVLMSNKGLNGSAHCPLRVNAELMASGPKTVPPTNPFAWRRSANSVNSMLNRFLTILLRVAAVLPSQSSQISFNSR